MAGKRLNVLATAALVAAVLLAGVMIAQAAAKAREYDEDEFEGFAETPRAPVIPAAAKPKAKAPEPAAPAAPATGDFDELLDEKDAAAPSASGSPAAAVSAPTPIDAEVRKTYEWEAVGCALILVFGIVYLWGKRTNRGIANKWLDQFMPLFQRQFAHVGIVRETKDAAPAPVMLHKESDSLFKFYASGRRFCVGLLAELRLQARPDLFSWIWGLVSSYEDILSIEIPLNKTEVDQFVFAVVRKSQRKNLLSEHQDLKVLCRQVNVEGLPKQLEVLTDAREVVPEILTAPVLAVITQYAKYFVLMHITDQAPAGETRGLSTSVLRLQFKLPSAGQMQDLNTLMEMTLHLVDVLGSLKLGKEAKARCVAARQQAEALAFKASHEQRQEELENRKREQRDKAQAEYDKLTPEQKAKRDAKEAKLQAKARAPRMRVKTIG